MRPFYKHQTDAIAANYGKKGLAFGCGAGKTRTTVHLAKHKGSILISAPKTTVLNRTWEREIQNDSLDLTISVMSKERFKKGAPYADVLILDEAHCFLGVLPATRYRNKIEIPRTSQLFEETLKWIETNKPSYIYLCSATPVPTPLAVWAVAKLFGEDWDYFAFRRRFYTFVPNIGRGVWVPRKDKKTEAELMVLAKKFWIFGRLEDFFDVPDQVHKPTSVGLSVAQTKALREVPLMYPDPMVRVGKKHQIEQGLFEESWLDEYKTREIIELAEEFPKLLVFAKYTEQIDMIAGKMKKAFPKRDVLILDGRTPDRKTLLERAELARRETIVIAQSQVSSSYELPSFRCTVFASMSYSFVDYEQALGRTQRANNISKNVYIYLLGGDVDKAVLDCVQYKKDFNELLFSQNK